MAYPHGGVDTFPAKLNKRQDNGVYAVQETLPVAGGQFDGYLAHDNVINSSVRVYTGPGMTGSEIATWTLSIPGDAPWRRMIRVYAAVAQVYITYETPGDQVDAEDVNVLQTSLTATQQEIERYKTTGVIDGGGFIEEEE